MAWPNVILATNHMFNLMALFVDSAAPLCASTNKILLGIDRPWQNLNIPVATQTQLRRLNKHYRNLIKSTNSTKRNSHSYQNYNCLNKSIHFRLQPGYFGKFYSNYNWFKHVKNRFFFQKTRPNLLKLQRSKPVKSRLFFKNNSQKPVLKLNF